MAERWLFECGRCGTLLALTNPRETLPPHQRQHPRVPCFNAGHRGIYRGRVGNVAEHEVARSLLSSNGRALHA